LVAVFLFVTVAKAAGFDQFGYNDTARIFNGTGASWCQAKGLPINCQGIYSPDKLIMKWNAEWDRGNDESWASPPYAAWENNEWNGKVKGGSGEVWHYKIVWVGGNQWYLTGNWTIDFALDGGGNNPYLYNLTLVQNGTTLTGLGQYPDPGPYQYAWNAVGTITDNTFSLVATYYLGANGTVMNMSGTIAPDGKISGTWNDNYGGVRTGTWSSVSGNATNPYWIDGGYSIWDQFEVIMDQGVSPDTGHVWGTHAIPNGYGNVTK
jgi:hypothetical protein